MQTSLQNNKLLNEYRKQTSTNTIDISSIKNLVIPTIETKTDNSDVVLKWNNFDKVRQQEVEKYWKTRTNQPYKSILKNENYKKNINDSQDLVIHKVTSKDKQGIDKKYEEYKSKVDLHNKELQETYSVNKQLEHKKKFEYKHIYQFRVAYNPKNDTELRTDKNKYYQEQQKKFEKDKQKADKLREELINMGIFDEDEITSIAVNNNNINKDRKKKEYLERKRQV